MGLREKVALRVAVIMLLQIISGTSSSRDKTLKSKQSCDNNQEAIRKMFNFPDIDYPTASTPRTHFYLQESNILQRNQVQRPVENPSSTTSPHLDIKKNIQYDSKKYNKPTKFKTTKNLEITKPFSEFDTASKSYCYTGNVAFPEVEYPLTAWDIRSNAKNWKQITSDVSTKNVNNNKPNSILKIDSNLKLNTGSSNKSSITSNEFQKCMSQQKSIDLNTTPSPAQDTNKSTVPYVITPYTMINLETTPSYIDTGTDENKNTTPAPKKKTNKKKNKKKKKKESTKKKALLTLIQNNPNDDECINSITSHSVSTLLPQEGLHVTKTIATINSVSQNEHTYNVNANKLDICSNISNESLSVLHGTMTTPANLTSDDHDSISPLKLNNDDKTPTVSSDKQVASISNDVNTIVSENRDNKYSCFEDNVRNSNKSSIYNVDEEFTTDVFPDFDENILSIITASTSTMSPMALDAVDEVWTNSEVIDPYKSVLYRDELDQYYIAVP